MLSLSFSSQICEENHHSFDGEDLNPETESLQGLVVILNDSKVLLLC